MEYNIENLKILSDVSGRNYLEKHLEKFIKKMSIIPRKYRKSNLININLSISKNDKLKLEISSNLNTGQIYYKKEGDDIKSIVPLVFDEFTEQIAVEIENIRQQFSIDKKNAFLETIGLDKGNLENLDEKKKVELFKSLIPTFLPGLKGYINRRIMSAKRAELKALSNIDPKDVVNEVVLRVHSSFVKDLKNISNINIWIIRETDNVLNEILDNYKAENISFEELVNNELGQLEEEYTIDGGGDLVMTDELDDFDMDFGVEEVILSTKGENDFIDNLDVSKAGLKDKIYDELVKLPLRYQSIYDLYFFEHMDYNEISKVKNIDSLEVEAIIISVKELLTEKLFN